MKPLLKRSLHILPIWLALCTTAFAQDDPPHSVNLPNAMTIHTWFVIAVTGAFLAWSISYSRQLQKEAQRRRKENPDLPELRDELLDRIIALENRKESGQISETNYRHELRELKFRLAGILEKTPQQPS